ncbi:MAG: flagellar hook assembly protein FlgD [Deltaproteobacteria bacterium]|nr:flagellar hook assembly protein FlgD [Deltaproteobacteria bacterium]
MQVQGVNPALDAGAIQKAYEKNLDKDAFLRLLVTQLQHQDPLEPMDNTAFVAQLAQFSSLEGITNIEKAVKGLTEEMSGAKDYGALSLIGKRLKVDGGVFRYSGEAASLGYTLDKDAAKAMISVFDSSGRQVDAIRLEGVSRGSHETTWGNGRTGDSYSFSVSAVDASGGQIPGRTFTSGPVTGVSFSSGRPVVHMNGLTVDMDRIIEIY